MELTVDDIIAATGAQVLARGADHLVQTISIDSRTFPVVESRTLTSGAWFVAIRGPHFDGHNFVAAAMEKGAGGCLVDRDSSLPLVPGGPSTPRRASGQRASWLLRVPNTLHALGAIAHQWRRRFATTPCVAITGSNGKSTTKEMVAVVAAARGPVLKTEGNFNNLIGVPLTVYHWHREHCTAVLEMGMSAQGEIATLTAIVEPTVGIITNVTAAHMEQLLTVENVAAAKGELFTHMRPEATVCINMEDPLVRELGQRFPGRKITYGMQIGCDVQFGRMASDGLVGVDLTVYLHGVERRLRLPIPGTHNVMNAMAAMAAGLALEIPIPEIGDRLPRFQPMKMRMERVQLANGVQVVNDSYNANPLSMEAALRTVGAVKRAGRFVAILGDMLELGPTAEVAHRTLGMRAMAAGVEALFVIGQYASAVAFGARAAGLPVAHVHVVDDVQALQASVVATIRSGDVVLVKGSRGMQMERVVDYLKDHCGTG